MWIMVVVVLLSSGLTNEQRLYPWPTLEACQAALGGAVSAWERSQPPGQTVLKAACERSG